MRENIKYQRSNIESGFTLIELAVVIFGFAILVWGTVALFSGIFTSSSQQSTLLSDTDQTRALVFQIADELRNGETGDNGAYVLDTAANQQIIFYSSSDDAGKDVAKMRYFVQNSKLYKGITQYANGAYSTSTEQVTLVQNDLANTSTPVFYYYDGSYTGSSTQVSLSQPVSVTAVKFVKINLQIYNKGGVLNNNIYTVTSGAAIRNLKTNLGN